MFTVPQGFKMCIRDRIRKGIGVAAFWYNTGVWPISLETSSCRMVLNQDGSIQVQVGETEIGQGADTALDVYKRQLLMRRSGQEGATRF